MPHLCSQIHLKKAVCQRKYWGGDCELVVVLFSKDLPLHLICSVGQLSKPGDGMIRDLCCVSSAFGEMKLIGPCTAIPENKTLRGSPALLLIELNT